MSGNPSEETAQRPFHVRMGFGIGATRQHPTAVCCTAFSADFEVRLISLQTQYQSFPSDFNGLALPTEYQVVFFLNYTYCIYFRTEYILPVCMIFSV